jgi:hypothetical protein
MVCPVVTMDPGRTPVFAVATDVSESIGIVVKAEIPGSPNNGAEAIVSASDGLSLPLQAVI